MCLPELYQLGLHYCVSVLNGGDFYHKKKVNGNALFVHLSLLQIIVSFAIVNFIFLKKEGKAWILQADAIVVKMNLG